MNVRTSSEMLAILSSAKNTCLDIVHKWRLGSTFFLVVGFKGKLNKQHLTNNIGKYQITKLTIT